MASTLTFPHGFWRTTADSDYVYVHESGWWALLHLYDKQPAGWYLVGPGMDGVCLAPDDGKPGLALLLAARKADEIVGAAVRHAYPDCTADNPPCDECRDGHA